jgi:hypothetical protein
MYKVTRRFLVIGASKVGKSTLISNVWENRHDTIDDLGTNTTEIHKVYKNGDEVHEFGGISASSSSGETINQITELFQGQFVTGLIIVTKPNLNEAWFENNFYCFTNLLKCPTIIIVTHCESSTPPSSWAIENYNTFVLRGVSAFIPILSVGFPPSLSLFDETGVGSTNRSIKMSAESTYLVLEKFQTSIIINITEQDLAAARECCLKFLSSPSASSSSSRKEAPSPSKKDEDKPKCILQ